MIKIIAAAALTIGMATSAMAAGGANDAQGGQNATPQTGTGMMNNDAGSNGTGTMAPDTNTTGSVNGAGNSGASMKTGTNCKNGGAGSTKTGTITNTPSTSSDSASSATCE